MYLHGQYESNEKHAALSQRERFVTWCNNNHLKLNKTNEPPQEQEVLCPGCHKHRGGVQQPRGSNQ